MLGVEEPPAGYARPGYRRFPRAGWLFKQKPLAVVAIGLALLVVLVALLAPLLAPFPYKDLVGRRFEPPGGPFLMGTDQIGRDVASRIIWGARISLYVGGVSTIIGVLLGSIVGITAAYFRGSLDLASQRVMDTLMAFPSILLALALMAVLGSSIANVIIALVVLFVPGVTRIMRSSTLSVAARSYVEAARAIGASHSRILLRHIAPNVVATAIVLFSINIGYAVVIEASLSFLGAGVPPEEPSWGGMLTYAAQTYVTVAPWIAIFPGLALSVTVLAFNLLGDVLRDALDPKLRGAGGGH